MCIVLQVVTLVDLAGHERYFKTTAYGLTGHLPDYACLIVGANAGVGLTLHSVNIVWLQTLVQPCHLLQDTRSFSSG